MVQENAIMGVRRQNCYFRWFDCYMKSNSFLQPACTCTVVVETAFCVSSHATSNSFTRIANSTTVSFLCDMHLCFWCIVWHHDVLRWTRPVWEGRTVNGICDGLIGIRVVSKLESCVHSPVLPSPIGSSFQLHPRPYVGLNGTMTDRRPQQLVIVHIHSET